MEFIDRMFRRFMPEWFGQLNYSNFPLMGFYKLNQIPLTQKMPMKNRWVAALFTQKQGITNSCVWHRSVQEIILQAEQ